MMVGLGSEGRFAECVGVLEVLASYGVKAIPPNVLRYGESQFLRLGPQLLPEPIRIGFRI